MPNASILDGATPHLGEGSRMPDGRAKLPAALAIASEGALTLIGASLNILVFSTILRSRRRPMQEASAYGATSPLTTASSKDRFLSRFGNSGSEPQVETPLEV